MGPAWQRSAASLERLNLYEGMVLSQERVNIAVFIDFDNIEIGVRTTLGEHFDVNVILEALKERGEVITKIAYADWTRAGEYSRHLTQHAIRLVQRNLTPGGDKNGADINLALDALEMAFTHTHINAYVIVGGDSDFLSLVEKLKQYNKKVFVIGGRAFTSVILQKNCHEFIAYENLIRKPTPVRGGRPPAPMASMPISQAFPLVRRAVKILSDREVSPQTGLLKSTLLQLDSTFSERNYGASSFLDFAEKLAQAGFVQLKHSGRSVMVELNPGVADEVESVKTRSAAEGEHVDAPVADNVANGAIDVAMSAPAAPDAAPAGRPEEAQSPLGDNAEGVRVAGQMLTAATGARWPMYLRNVKQILRAASFDERRFGFGGLMDLLKACQREGLIRIERDRRGGLRVFQGQMMARGNVAPVAVSSIVIEEDDDRQPIEINAVQIIDEVDGDVIEEPPVTVVDTTAELLGRAKPRKPRVRAGAGDAPVAAAPSRAHRTPTSQRKPVAKKAAPAARKGRAKKDGEVDGNR
jgi:uncharacterized LabA/DUF88 family protein